MLHLCVRLTGQIEKRWTAPTPRDMGNVTHPHCRGRPSHVS
jgi:hypothetical protein